MGSFNRVVLMGNLTRDPELRYTPDGKAVCNVSFAVNEKVKSGDEWVEKVTFVEVTLFGMRGEAFAKFHKKGTLAFIEGKLRLNRWDDKETGKKRSKLYVVAKNWEFVSGGHDKQKRPTATQAHADTGGWPDEEAPF